jgi:organic hydroperoxide reductase OsmC/OhrA
MTQAVHEYAARLVWDGNTGTGTATYSGYGRKHRVLIDGKPDLEGSADPMFKGDADRPNPEDLFLAAIASCHMLSYLALCAWEGVNVVAYEDEVRGTLEFDGRGSGKFTEVVLRPVVTITAGSDAELAQQLHEKAHEQCYVAASCSVPILHEPTVRSGQVSGEHLR